MCNPESAMALGINKDITVVRAAKALHGGSDYRQA